MASDLGPPPRRRGRRHHRRPDPVSATTARASATPRAVAPTRLSAPSAVVAITSIQCVDQRKDGTPPPPPPPSYYCDLCMEEGHGRRSRFCKNRPRPAPKAKPTQPHKDAEDAMDVTPATSDAATQADIMTFSDLLAFKPLPGNEDFKRERQWIEDTDPMALNLLPNDAKCEVTVTRPYHDSREIVEKHLSSVDARHCCPPDNCGSHFFVQTGEFVPVSLKRLRRVRGLWV